MQRRILDRQGLNAVTEYSYNFQGNITRITRPGGSATDYEYNALDQVTKVTPVGFPAYAREFQYDNRNNLRRVAIPNVDKDGTVDPQTPKTYLTLTYDSSNRLTARTWDVDASTTATESVTYTGEDLIDILQDPTGKVHKWIWDERGLPFKSILGSGTPQEAINVIDYDADGNLDRSTSPTSSVLTAGFDNAGRIIGRVAPDGSRFVYQYDASGMGSQREYFDAAGVRRSLVQTEYNALGLPTTSKRSTLDASGAVVSTTNTMYEYDERGLLVTVTDGLGQDMSFQYDDARRLTQVVNPSGDGRIYFYNAAGQVSRMDLVDVDSVSGTPTIYRYEYGYDSLGRLVGAVLFGQSGVQLAQRTYAYDGFSNLVEEADAQGNIRSYEYDFAGNLTHIKRELRQGGVGSGTLLSTETIVQTYDLAGRVLSRTDGSGNARQYTYDAVGNLVKTTNADTTCATFVYDGDSRLTQYTDPNGTVVSLAYDTVGRVTGRAINRAPGVLGTTAETYAYGPSGELITGTDDDSQISRAYDGLVRIVSETQTPASTAAYTVAVQYDALDNVSQVTYPDATGLTFHYSNSGQLLQIKDLQAALVAEYEYGGALRWRKRTLGNGVKTLVSFDNQRRVVAWENQKADGTQLSRFEYAYNSEGLLHYEKRIHESGKGDNYEYDSVGRLTRGLRDVADPAAELATPGSQTYLEKIEFNYDAVGNRTQRIRTPWQGAATTTSYAANAMNEYTSVGGTAHTYDANGNLLDDGTHTYAYDYRDQLVEVRRKADGVVLVQFEYDVEGRVTRSGTPGAMDRHIHWGNRRIASYDSSGAPRARYVFGRYMNEVLRGDLRDVGDVDADGNVTELYPAWFTSNRNYSTSEVTDGTGTHVELFRYGLSGQPQFIAPGGAGRANSVLGVAPLFDGSDYHPVSGLYLMRARAYSPTLGRFIQRDPAGMWAEEAHLGNAYAFAASSPQNFMDPLGERLYLSRFQALPPGPKWRAMAEDGVAAILKALSFICEAYTYEVARVGKNDPDPNKGVEYIKFTLDKEKKCHLNSNGCRLLSMFKDYVDPTKKPPLGTLSANWTIALSDEHKASNRHKTIKFDVTSSSVYTGDTDEAGNPIYNEANLGANGEPIPWGYELSLGHELAHAYWFSLDGGKHLYGGGRETALNKESLSLMREAQVVGVGKWWVSAFTENSIRRDHGMAKRRYYHLNGIKYDLWRFAPPWR